MTLWHMYVPFRSAALKVRGIETQGVDVYSLRTGHIPLNMVWCSERHWARARRGNGQNGHYPDTICTLF